MGLGIVVPPCFGDLTAASATVQDRQGAAAGTAAVADESVCLG